MKREIDGWIARNKEDDEVIFCPGPDAPTRMHNYWFCGFTWSYCTLPRESFDDVKWENEPIKVKAIFETI